MVGFVVSTTASSSEHDEIPTKLIIAKLKLAIFFMISFLINGYCYKNLNVSAKLRNIQSAVKTVVMIVNRVKNIVHLQTNLRFKTLKIQYRTKLCVCNGVTRCYLFVLGNSVLLQRCFCSYLKLILLQQITVVQTVLYIKLSVNWC